MSRKQDWVRDFAFQKALTFLRAMADSTALGFIPMNKGLNILTTSGEITLLYGLDF